MAKLPDSVPGSEPDDVPETVRSAPAGPEDPSAEPGELLNPA